MARPRVIQSFAPMSDYERQVAEARRRQALAEALESQAYRPLQGDAAPIPSAAPLVMALQGFMSARQRRKAEEAGERAKTAEMEEFETLRKSLEPQERVAQPDMFASPDEMASKYTAPRMETYTPSQEERTKVLERAYFGGSPRAAKYAEYLLTKKSPEAEEFGTTPVLSESGEYIVFGKSGTARPTGVKGKVEPKLPTSVQEYEYAKGQGFQGTLADWERQNRAAGAPRITIDKGGELAQELFLKDLSEQSKAVRGAEGIINKLDEMTASTAKGTFTGGLAPGAVGAAQFLQTFGIQVDPDTVANTRSFQAASNQLVLDFMAANGGARGFTQEETRILQDAFPKIVDSPQARMQITKLLRDRAQQTISNYNQTVDQYKSTYPSSVIPFRKVETEEERYQRWLRQQGKPK